MNIKRIQDISLKWKLIIPFLFLAAMGATSLFVVSYRFQSSLIRINEEQGLRNLYQFFLNDLAFKKNKALSLAYLTARNPEVAAALALRDRTRLTALMTPAYETLKQDFGVQQFHFHVPPATSFFRLHAPGQYGEKMEAYRPTINRVRETGIGVGGIEMGVLGLSIRSVAPVFHQGRQVGTVEVGLSLGKPLLEEFKKSYQAEATLYLQKPADPETPEVFAATMDQPLPKAGLFRGLVGSGALKILPESLGSRKMSVLFGPVRDFSGKIIGLVKISVDRSPALALLEQYAWSAAGLGLLGLIVSITFVWLVAIAFTRRIDAVIEGADEIASGQRDTRLPVTSGDELDVMARAINRMLQSLDASQLRLREYAQDLELMVEQRTKSLKESEQTYRTLVENVPLIVYMVGPDGKTWFLNRATEPMIGLSPEALNEDYQVWASHIHLDDRLRVLTLRQECLKEKKELHIEYRLIHQDGSLVYCFDHAVPVFDENNEFFRMDGIIINVTVQKELQEKNLQTQELETLGQISTRLAHELRNPLTAIGGLARRMAKSFESTDPRVEKGRMILEQVQKLEKILTMMLTFITPPVVHLQPGHVNAVVLRAVEGLGIKFQGKGFSVTLHLDQSLVPIQMDEGLLEKALKDLLENAWYRMGQKGEMDLATQLNGGSVVITLLFQVTSLSPDDLDHYFFPFTIDISSKSGDPVGDPTDVSLSKVIIHKHGGSIGVTQEGARTIKLTISMPVR